VLTEFAASVKVTRDFTERSAAAIIARALDSKALKLVCTRWRMARSSGPPAPMAMFIQLPKVLPALSNCVRTLSSGATV
jgi:hypothetical protein